jgi:hypothetical protein
MSNENPEGSSQNVDMDTVLVEDLVLTDSFLVKGVIEGKTGRLSRHLDLLQKRFLPIRNATMVDLRGGEPISSPRILVNLEEVVLAHELVETGGDVFQRNLARDQKTVRVRAFFSGNTNIEISGMVRPGAYDMSDLVARRFFVMENPVVRGIDLALSSDLAILGKMQYAILHKDRISYVYDFS